MNRTCTTPWFYESHRYYGARWLSRTLAALLYLGTVGLTRMEEKLYDSVVSLFEPLGRRACPILKKDEWGRLTLVGTGVPVIDGRVGMLLTATHVLKELNQDQIIIAGTKTMMRFPLIASGFSRYNGGNTIDVDVCALALPAEAVNEMRGFYAFTNATELGNLEDENVFTLYGFVGYPHSKNRWRPAAELRVTPHTYATTAFGRMDGVVTQGKTDWVHFAMKFPRKAIRRGQQRLIPPEPYGISGCGVWKVSLDRHSGNASKPALVGIGIEYIARSNLLIATRIGAASVAVSTLRKDIEAGKAGGTGLTLQFDANIPAATDS